MILVVSMNTEEVLGKFEAWDIDAYQKAINFIKQNHHKYMTEEITFMGDMVIWVA